MEAIKKFVFSCIEKLKANPTLMYVLIGLAAFIVVVLVVIIALSIKRAKTKKRLAIEAKEAEARKRAEEKHAEEHAKREKLEAEKHAQKQAIEAKKAEAKKAADEAEAKRRAEAEAEHARLAQEAEEKRLAEEAEKQRIADEKKAAEEAKRLADEEAIRKLEEATRKAEEAQRKAEEAVKKAEAAKKAAKKASTVKAVEVKPAPKKTAASKSTVKKEVAPAKAKTTIYDEMKDAEVEDDIWYDESETEKAARYKGKWTICRVITDDASDGEEMYFFELHASNGEKLLSSEEYTSYNGALRGIETHKANILKDNFKVTLSKKGDYIFKLLSGKNMLLCMGENYPTRARCESAIESTKRFAKTAVIDENVQDHIVKVPAEDDTETLTVPDGYNGKWLISSGTGADGETVYYFELYANNGEKLLSSEEYASYIGAVNGIQTHKTNIEKGNFRISLTKRGDYIYKLLNGNGQLLCLGEHYKTKRRCLNAVESVKRFAANSPVLADSEIAK